MVTEHFSDESEVLTAADTEHHINKTKFDVPFVCGAKNLGEALRRIGEGASMIRMKGKAGTGNIVEAVRHTREIFKEIRRLKTMDEDEVAECLLSKNPTHLLRSLFLPRSTSAPFIW